MDTENQSSNLKIRFSNGIIEYVHSRKRPFGLGGKQILYRLETRAEKSGFYKGTAFHPGDFIGMFAWACNSDKSNDVRIFRENFKDSWQLIGLKENKIMPALNGDKILTTCSTTDPWLREYSRKMLSVGLAHKLRYGFSNKNQITLWFNDDVIEVLKRNNFSLSIYRGSKIIHGLHQSVGTIDDIYFYSQENF